MGTVQSVDAKVDNQTVLPVSDRAVGDQSSIGSSEKWPDNGLPGA